MKNQKETRFFHDSLTILILGSLIITFLMIFISISIRQSVKFSKSKSNAVAYQQEYSFSIKEKRDNKNPNITVSKAHALEDCQEIYQELCSLKAGNVFVDFIVTTGDDYLQRKAQLIFASNEELKEKQEKEYIDYKNAKEPIVILGDGYENSIEDGKYIINGDEYKVAGILENKTYTPDYRMILFAANCGKGMKTAIINNIDDECLPLHFCTNKESSDLIVHEIKKTKKLLKEKIGVESKYRKVDEEVTEDDLLSESDEFIKIIQSMSKYMFDLFFVFTGLNVFFLLRIWIKRREQELSIRKAFGYSTVQLAGTIFAELISIEVIAFVIALAATFLWMECSFTTVPYLQLLYNIPYFGIATGIITILYVFLILLRVRRVHPVNGIKQC